MKELKKFYPCKALNPLPQGVKAAHFGLSSDFLTHEGREYCMTSTADYWMPSHRFILDVRIDVILNLNNFSLEIFFTDSQMNQKVRKVFPMRGIGKPKHSYEISSSKIRIEARFFYKRKPFEIFMHHARDEVRATIWEVGPDGNYKKSRALNSLRIVYDTSKKSISYPVSKI